MTKTLWTIAVAVVAVVCGFAGAALYHTAFPARGPAGVTGPPGPSGAVGPQGEAGPPGQAASVDLSKVGVCYNAPTFTANGMFGANSTNEWVTSVYLYAPTDTGGVLSCGSGTYVSFQPTTSTGGQ
jgi:hypothetical protein